VSRVLVIDDSTTLRKLVEIAMRGSGIEIDFAATGSDGVSRARSQRPDAILLDFLLPDLSSTEVCQRLADDSTTSRVPIVVMSANQPSVFASFQKFPTVVDFVGKPFTPSDIRSRLESAVKTPIETRRTRPRSRSNTLRPPLESITALPPTLLAAATRSLHEIGETYYQRCATILAEISNANKDVTDMQATPRGKLRITAPADLSTGYMGRIISEFCATHADIRVELTVTDRFVDLIAESYDLALRVGHLRESTLIARRLTKATGILCASPSYLARRGTPTRIEELAEHDLALFLPDSFTHFTLTNGKRTFELSSAQQFVVNHYAPVRDAVIAGLGIGNLSTFSATNDLAAGTLVQVLPEWTSGEFFVNLVYPARRNVPARVSLFIEHLLMEFDPPPWERTVAWKRG